MKHAAKMGNGADDKPNARSASAFENADLDRSPRGLLRNGTRIQLEDSVPLRRRARQRLENRVMGKTPDEFGGVMQKRPLNKKKKKKKKKKRGGGGSCERLGSFITVPFYQDAASAPS